MWMALALSVVAVAYNNTVNWWAPFHRGAYVPVNLAFGAAMTIVAVAAYELPGDALGLGGDVAWTAAVGLGVAAFGAGMHALSRSRHGHRIADARVAGLRGPALAWHVAARIPLGTALTEEVVFRGVLFAAWREAGAPVAWAAVFAAVAFGLWHVAPTIVGVRMNAPDATPVQVGLAVAAAVVATAAAGLFLTWLRVEGSGLLAPVVLHAGVNATSAWAAVRAARRVRSG